MNKFFGLVGIGCLAVLLTGCGGKGNSEHALKCVKKTEGQEVTIEIQYNDEETKAESATLDMIVPIPSGTSESEIQIAKSTLKSSCSSGTYEKCEVNETKEALTMHFEGTPENISGIEDSKTLKEAKESLEADLGYTCE